MKTLQPPAICKSDRMTARGGVRDPICNSLSGIRCDTVQLPIGRGSDSSLWCFGAGPSGSSVHG